jgi:hypothetical protein
VQAAETGAEAEALKAQSHRNLSIGVIVETWCQVLTLNDRDTDTSTHRRLNVNI